MSLRNSYWRHLFFGSVLGLLSGCGGTPQYGTVTGQVTLDGQPLDGAFIQFFPQQAGAGTIASGRTDAEGMYEMFISDAHRGILPGTYLVEIQTSDIAFDEQGHEYNTPELVPPRYNRRTELRDYVVHAGESHTYNFELQSTAVSSQRGPHQSR